MVSKFSALFPEDRDREPSVIWQMVSAVSSIGATRTSASSPSEWRSSPSGCRALVGAAREHLEHVFKKFVQATVYDNPRGAQLGGVPGTFQLVRSFLNIKLDSSSPGR